MTNGDKIRSMTDEELAHYLYNHTDCAFYSCPAYKVCEEFKSKESCRQVILAWLEMEDGDDCLR